MKSLTISMALMMLVAVTALAAVPLKIDLHQLNSRLGVAFKIDTESTGNLVVTLRDQERKVLFQKAYNGANHYRGIVNLEAANDGVYYLEVRQGAESVRRQIHLTRENRRLVRLNE